MSLLFSKFFGMLYSKSIRREHASQRNFEFVHPEVGSKLFLWMHIFIIGSSFHKPVPSTYVLESVNTNE